jgi:hypothetical protein
MTQVRYLLVCVAAVCVAAPARADKIDAKLHEQAPAILASLKKAELKNVGVLRFRAEIGKRAESFDIGPINDGLAARIENLLVIHADRMNTIGVLRDPNTAAASARLGGWYTSADVRRKLFEQEYPLAWGTKKARPDAFLTGVVRCKGDMTTTTVVVEMFTAKEPTRFVPLVEFSVPTDRLILADLGVRFSVPRQPGIRRGADDMDRFVIGEVRRREETGSNGDIPRPTDAVDVGGVTYRLRVNSETVSFRSTGSAGAAWEMTSPSPDKVITMTLKNTTPKRVGVVLKINEVSTIFYQTEDSALCRKWIVDSGKEIQLKGFYQEDNRYAPFKVIVGEEAKTFALQQGDKAGLIRIEVFDEVVEEEGAFSPLTMSLPRRIPEARLKAARESLDTLRPGLLASARAKIETRTEILNGKAIKREIVVPDKDALKPSPEVKEVEFKAASAPTAVEMIRIVTP